MIFKIDNDNDGFTIIELLVVFTVMVLIAGVSFVAFVSYNRRQVVEQSVLDYKLMIEKAKFNALSRVGPDKRVADGGDISNCSTLQKYEIRVGQDQKTYSLHVVCDNGEAVILTKELPDDVSFYDGDRDCAVGFNLLSSSSLQQSEIVYKNDSCVPYGELTRITIMGNGITKYVDIDNGGNVSIDED